MSKPRKKSEADQSTAEPTWTGAHGRDPWGGLFENPDDWIAGYIAGNPPLRLAKNWMDSNPWLAEAVYYDAASELIREGRCWEDCPLEVQTEYMAKHLKERIGKMLQAALMAHIEAIKKAGEEVLAAADNDALAAGYTPETAPTELIEERRKYHAARKREEWGRTRTKATRGTSSIDSPA